LSKWEHEKASLSSLYGSLPSYDDFRWETRKCGNGQLLLFN